MRERGLGRDSVAEHSPSVVGHGLHCQHCETNQGRRREGGDRAEPRLYCCVYRKTRQVNAAVQLLAQRKQMTRLTSSQGQTPALSYEREALCSAICSLVNAGLSWLRQCLNLLVVGTSVCTPRLCAVL